MKSRGEKNTVQAHMYGHSVEYFPVPTQIVLWYGIGIRPCRLMTFLNAPVLVEKADSVAGYARFV